MLILCHAAAAQGELTHVVLGFRHLATSSGNELVRYRMLGTTPFLSRAPSVRLVAIGMKKATVIERR